MRSRAFVGLIPFVVAACVPADHALDLGSLEFTIKASHLTTEGVPANIVDDDWKITVQRAVFSFKTVTIGQNGVSDRCSYRGSAQKKNVVFDVRYGNVQTFDGIEPQSCPDVGFVLGPPDNLTVPGAGVTGADVVSLAAGEPAHAYLEMTATSFAGEEYHLQLRFPTVTTPSNFGGCATSVKGVRVRARERVPSSIAFSADALFRDALSSDAALRFSPFRDADVNGDHLITMDELDALPLDNARIYSDSYHFQDGTTFGPFGLFVRLQLKFAFFFDEDGACVGDDPGTKPSTP